MLRYKTSTFMTIATLIAVYVPAFADDDALIAKVNGTEIHQSEINAALSSLDPQLSQLPEDQQKLAVLSSVIEIKLLSKEALAKGLDKTPDYKSRMNYLSERELHNAYFRKEVLGKVTPEEVKARYQKESASLAKEGQEEIRVRHILVKTADEAKTIIKELNAGKKFEDLAKEKSIDPSSDKGGDLGYFTKGHMLKEFEDAAFALKKGAFTQKPVKDEGGMHIIKLEDRRTLSLPPLEQIEPQISQIIMRDKYISLLEGIKKSSKMEILDEGFVRDIRR